MKNKQSFSNYLRNKYTNLWESHFNHPFVTALGKGTLPKKNFSFYIQQDTKYLNEFLKVYAYAITKATSPAEIEYFAKGILRIVQIEQSLHNQYGKRFGFTSKSLQSLPMAPANYDYTKHLLYIGVNGTYAEILAAILPCVWLYGDVGHFLVEKNHPVATHPYYDWLTTYDAVSYLEVVTWLRNCLDKHAISLATTEKKMLEKIFVKSMVYELLFWDMAWDIEQLDMESLQS